MKKKGMVIFKVFLGIAIIWALLTLIAEFSFKKKINMISDSEAAHTALLVYNPDPFYNLDEQVCEGFARGLGQLGWQSKVATVSSAYTLIEEDFDLYVFCANTYNWAPDWAISGFIKKTDQLEEKQVAAITLGSGSTQRAKRILEDLIEDKEAHLLGSRTYWLMRPNDETRLEESNVKVAVEMATDFGVEMAQKLEAMYSYH